MIKPYVVRPVPLPVALVIDPETAVDAEGSPHELADGEALRLYADAAVARGWATRGVGALLVWKDTPVRWISPHGAQVSLIDHVPADPVEAVTGLGLWAEWAAFYGADVRSVGSTAWSLLRAQLDAPLWIGVGTVPPLRVVVGGRQEQTVPPGSSHVGPYVLWDLPAAYAAGLGELVYGGWWRRFDDKRLSWDGLAEHGPMFARATVDVSSTRGMPGPLPRRPLRPQTAWDTMLNPVEYPRAGTMRGVWSWPELVAAREAGHKVKVHEVWSHQFADSRTPFAAWWEAISDGRAIGGWAGALAKQTGNALVGQFAIGKGTKHLVTYDAATGRPTAVKLDPGASWTKTALDLFEYVAGSVRAKLYADVISQAGDLMLACHTDGAWVYDTGEGWSPGGDWRAKDRASAIDLIDPQHLAYVREGEVGVRYKLAGEPVSNQAAGFAERWASVSRARRETA